MKKNFNPKILNKNLRISPFPKVLNLEGTPTSSYCYLKGIVIKNYIKYILNNNKSIQGLS